MFHKMRRKDRLLSGEDTQRILKKGEYGVLCTTGPDGYPYGVPVNYIFLKGKVYFHCAADAGQKCANINHCSKVCFTVTGSTETIPSKFSTRYESAVVFGSAARVTDAVQKHAVLEALILKYCSSFHAEGLDYIERAGKQTDVFEIVPVHMTGKANR